MALTDKGKRRLIGLILLVVVLGIVAGVAGYIKYRSTHIITDDAFIGGDIYAVSAQIGGKVSEVKVKENQQVKAGDTIVLLDPRDIEADLATAQSNLEVVKNQVAGQRAAMDVVNSQIAALTAQKELLDKEKERYSALLDQKQIAVDTYDHVLSQWKAINSQIEAADNQRKQIETTIGTKDDQGNESAIRLAQDQIDRLSLNLEHTHITAPASGFITRKNVTVGQVVAIGQPLLSVVPLEGQWIVANYKETDLTRVKPGQKVVFKVDTYPGKSFDGEVESIMAGTGAVFSLLPPENATGNYIKVVQRVPVRIKITSPDPEQYPLRIGMSVQPVILVEGK